MTYQRNKTPEPAAASSTHFDLSLLKQVAPLSEEEVQQRIARGHVAEMMASAPDPMLMQDENSGRDGRRYNEWHASRPDARLNAREAAAAAEWKWCDNCRKEGHKTGECWSTHAKIGWHDAKPAEVQFPSSFAWPKDIAALAGTPNTAESGRCQKP